MLVQPSVYGDDNACLLDALRTMGDTVRGVTVVSARTTQRDIEQMDKAGVRGARLNLAVEELAPKHGVTIHRSPSLDPDLPGTSLHLTADGEIDSLQKAVAKRFGVNRRFIQVRMKRYGLLKPGAKIF